MYVFWNTSNVVIAPLYPGPSKWIHFIGISEELPISAKSKDCKSYRYLKIYDCMYTHITIAIQSSYHIIDIHCFTLNCLFILLLCRLYLCCCKVNPNSAHTCLNQWSNKKQPRNASDSVTVFRCWMQSRDDTFDLVKLLFYIGLVWDYQSSLRVPNIGILHIFFVLFYFTV